MHMFEMLKMINMNLITFQDNTNVLGMGLEKKKTVHLEVIPQRTVLSENQ